MTEPVTLDDIKVHLRLGAGVTDEDAYLESLITGARRMVEKETQRSFSGDTPTLTGDDAEVGKQAIRLIVGNWYANRESVSTDARSAPIALPQSAEWIFDDLRAWYDGSD